MAARIVPTHKGCPESATPSVTLDRYFSLAFYRDALIIALSMYSSITPQQANGLRVGGYFMMFVGLLTVFGWAGAIQDYYVTEHQWPAASATVYSLTERAKEVQPVARGSVTTRSSGWNSL